MATFDTSPVDALSVPLGDLIASVGRGIADAQRDMDVASLATLQEIYESNEGFFKELQGIGYRPQWYHIPEAEGQIQVALTVTGQASNTPGATNGKSKVRVYAAPIDAGYTSRFNFTLEASSSVKFRIVPVPPSSAAESIQVVPALVGLTVAETRARLALLGIPSNLGTAVDAAIVNAQDPAAGNILPLNGVVTIQTA